MDTAQQGTPDITQNTDNLIILECKELKWEQSWNGPLYFTYVRMQPMSFQVSWGYGKWFHPPAVRETFAVNYGFVPFKLGSVS